MDPAVSEKFYCALVQAVLFFGVVDMVASGANGAEVRGGACRFPAEFHKGKVKASEGRVVEAGNSKNSPPVSGDTAALDTSGQDTGNSDRVGVPTAGFRLLCEIDGL